MADLKICIPEELFATAESSSYSGELELPVFEQGGLEFRFADALPWQVTITNTSEAFLVMGTISGTATCDCSRCLEEAVVDVDGEVEGYFLLPGIEVEEDEEEEEGFEALPEDHVIDLEPLLLSALSLAVPFAPLCKDDCKGLCPQCGANLNEGPCGCEEEEFVDESNPFAVLRNLKFEE